MIHCYRLLPSGVTCSLKVHQETEVASYACMHAVHDHAVDLCIECEVNDIIPNIIIAALKSAAVCHHLKHDQNTVIASYLIKKNCPKNMQVS